MGIYEDQATGIRYKYRKGEKGVSIREISHKLALQTAQIYPGNNYPIEHIVVPAEIDGMPVTNLCASLFYQIPRVRSITVPDTVTYIGESCFALCENLEEIILPCNITEIGKRACESCISLKTVKMPQMLMSISERCFMFCSALPALDIPDSVIGIGPEAFFRCESLERVTFGKSITVIGKSAFEGCESLQDLYIPDTVVRIDCGAVNGCISLKTIHLPHRESGETPCNVQVIGLPTCLNLSKVERAGVVYDVEVHEFEDKYAVPVTDVFIKGSFLKAILPNGVHITGGTELFQLRPDGNAEVRTIWCAFHESMKGKQHDHPLRESYEEAVAEAIARRARNE